MSKRGAAEAGAGRAGEVLSAFFRLGCTSFGGPIAHLGYFRTEFVERRRWCSEERFAEIVALAQSLPGPASSQTGFALGLLRAGWLGGLAAWTGFTLPSALLMLAFALGHGRLSGRMGLGALHGLQLVAVAVVAQAILAMRRALAPDAARMALALLAAVLVFFSGETLLAIAVGALAGWLLPGLAGAPAALAQPAAGEPVAPQVDARLDRRAGLAAGAAFCALLLLLPAAAALLAALPGGGKAGRGSDEAGQTLAVADAFFRSGALVFGGGHVVLPLLEKAVVHRGWVDEATFLSGYGAAQAVPGPLFTFAAYLGAEIRPSPSPVAFSALALASIFLPGLLLMAALLPFWEELRRRRWMRGWLAGVNAAVVGVLMAAFLRPVCTSAVLNWFDGLVALAAMVLLMRFRVAPWLLVLLVATLSALVRLQ
jgi:chromate transporter